MGGKWLHPDLILQVLTVSSLLAARLKSNENSSIAQQRERGEKSISKKEKQIFHQIPFDAAKMVK